MPIAFDAATNGGSATTTSLTFAHTTSGSDRVLIVNAVVEQGADDITDISYNGVPMTRVDFGNQGGFTVYMYILVAPALGTNNVVVTLNTNIFVAANAISYTGCAQTGQPDNFTKQLTNSNTTQTTSLVTVVDNCWTVLSSCGYTLPPVAGTGSTSRGLNNNAMNYYDSNAAITPAGSYSMTLTHVITDAFFSMMVSLAPVPTGPAPIVLTEIITLIDSLVRGITRPFSEVVTVVDGFTYLKSKTLQIATEIITIVDSITKTPGKIFIEVVTIVDSINRSIQRSFSEVVTLVDSVYTFLGALFLTEIITITDSMTKIQGKFFSEIITVVDVTVGFFKRARGILRGVSKLTSTLFGARNNPQRGVSKDTGTMSGTINYPERGKSASTNTKRGSRL